MPFRIHLGKENFKFSCSHFTIFSEHEAERLHGHNYQISIHLNVGEVDPSLGFAFDFNLVKPHIKTLCDELDEFILIPTRSPFLKILEQDTQVEVRFHNKVYSFPKADTRLLPITNISTEELAKYFGESLCVRIGSLKGWTAMEIYVEETRGQSVSFSMPRP